MFEGLFQPMHLLVIFGSHVPMLSQPERVLDIIRTAAKTVQGATAAA